MMKDLEALIQEMDEKGRRELSDEFLRETGRGPTREEYSIGEYSYGIVTVPIAWVYPFLQELLKRRKQDETRRNA